PGPREVKKVVQDKKGLLTGMTPGGIIVDLSTVDPFTTKEMAEEAKRKGIGYLDAPILGRPISAGQWVVLIGGDEEVLERCRPILETFGSRLVHVGPSGTGNAIKLINQLMFSTINAITVEALAIAKKVGLSPKVVFDTISQSNAATVSGLFCEVGKKIVEGDFEPTFSIDLLCKDNGLGIEMAKRYGAFPIISSYVQTLNEIAKFKGLGDKDTAALIKLYEEFMSI
ncbi:NAD(P)-dependent oxidoreductase, partial [Candidatus Aerophobetes bacterium]|nr:NAD(P)-dependent oxidoreductase [Candidatus Aerophobetes bacterium]